MLYINIYVSLGKRKRKVCINSLSCEYRLYKLSQDCVQSACEERVKAVEREPSPRYGFPQELSVHVLNASRFPSRFCGLFLLTGPFCLWPA